MRTTDAPTTHTGDEQVTIYRYSPYLGRDLGWQYRLLALGTALLLVAPSSAGLLAWVYPNGPLSEQGGVAAVLGWIMAKLLWLILGSIAFILLVRFIFAVDTVYVLVRLSRVAAISKLYAVPAVLPLFVGPELVFGYAMVNPQHTIWFAIPRVAILALALLSIHLVAMRSVRSKLDSLNA